VTDPLATLLASLELRALAEDRYEAHAVERARRRMFGGELLAQTLVAAARTVKDRACQALHAHFLAAADPGQPVEYRVRRVRDGRRFAHRQVSALQRDREVAIATVAFTVDPTEAPGYQHESACRTLPLPTGSRPSSSSVSPWPIACGPRIGPGC